MNIMMKNETWLYNTTWFVHNTSWIYERSAKGLCAQAKARCFEESKMVFKCYRYSYINIQNNDTCDKRIEKTLVVILMYLFYSLLEIIVCKITISIHNIF
jgi:hypothetical protein